MCVVDLQDPPLTWSYATVSPSLGPYMQHRQVNCLCTVVATVHAIAPLEDGHYVLCHKVQWDVSFRPHSPEHVAKHADDGFSSQLETIGSDLVASWGRESTHASQCLGQLHV